jgi:uncharacterized membrane protein YtjA (UPF0391 family)
MLYYTWIFLLIALIAGLFGFGVIASTAAGIAKILFFVFLVIFLISLISAGDPFNALKRNWVAHNAGPKLRTADIILGFGKCVFIRRT